MKAGLVIYIHALLAESDARRALGFVDPDISIHALLAESDSKLAKTSWTENISIHALLAESDFTTIISICIVLKFLSTLSLRRATHGQRPNWGECQISIHALLAESDTEHRANSQQGKNISIHALLAESDPTLDDIFKLFANFYPRSPCGERQSRIDPDHVPGYFYPRSPCGERHLSLYAQYRHLAFLSTLSLRRATLAFCVVFSSGAISIHALLAESDFPPIWTLTTHKIFLSTLSLRRATLKG